MCSIEKFLCPDLALLLNQPQPAALPAGVVCSPDGQICVDRLVCLKTMQDPYVPASIAWECGQLLDSVKHCPDARFLVPLSECCLGAVCSELTILLSPLHVSGLDLSFFESLSTVEMHHLLPYLLSKTLNQRCQGRKFSTVAIRGLDENPKVRKQLAELVLCSLLGMYRISKASSRPGPDVRDQLYCLLRHPNGIWLEMLFEKCRSAIVMYCLREHVIFLVDEHPALAHQIADVVQFAKFKTIVVEAMAVLRDYIQRMLSTAGTSLLASATGALAGHVDPGSNTRWVEEVMFLLQPYDAAILKISYRRPKQTFRQFLLSVGNSNSDAEGVMKQWLNREEVECIRRLADRLSDATSGILTEMIHWMPCFRIAPAVMKLVLLLVDHHNTGTSSLEVLRRFLVRVIEINPRAFQFLQVASELIQDSQKVKLLAELPLEYAVNQIDACQARFGMKSKDECDPAGVVLDHMFSFFYCDVCFTVYSVLADANSVYKQDYAFAFRNAVQDYQTGHLYCDKKRRNYRGSCDAQPLKSVLLLGNVLRVNGAMVMMCPQEKCGRPMVINRNCVINERGWACCYCSQKLQPSIRTFRETMDYYRCASSLRRCAVCAVELHKTVGIYVYPYRIYVCKLHTCAPIISRVSALVAEQALDLESTHAEKRAEIETMIIDIATLRESSKRAVQAESDKKKWKRANMLAKFKQ